MPEGLGTIISLLVLGYLLLLAELFVPGAVLGILGLGAVAYGCYLAFGLGTLWGMGTVTLSVIITTGGLITFFKSSTGKRLMLSDQQAKTWKAPDEGLGELVGKEGVTLSKLRPAGVADIEGRRLDVVSDSDFLESGVRVRVCEVEGNRVVVEAVAVPPEAAETDDPASAAQ